MRFTDPDITVPPSVYEAAENAALENLRAIGTLDRTYGAVVRVAVFAACAELFRIAHDMRAEHSAIAAALTSANAHLVDTYW